MLACAILPAGSALAAGLPTEEVVRFDSLAADGAAPVALKGLLFVPGGPVPERKRAAIVALHGCGGLHAKGKSDPAAITARYREAANAFVEAGYVVLLPDSLGPRGRDEICTVPMRERTITAAQRRLDALGALAWLAGRPDVDRERVALIGWSHGASTVLATVNAADPAVVRWRERDKTPFFRTAVAFYPGCSPAQRDASWAPATPLAILIGGADDWTPAAPCEALAERARDANWPLEVVVYPGAYHGFDAPTGKVRLRRDVPNGVTPGQGVHVGPDAKAREAANARVAAILADALGR